MTTKTSKSGRGGQHLPGLTGGSPGKGKPGGKSGKKGRKPVAPVKVGRDRNWGPIALFVVVGLVASGIIGYAFWMQRGTDTAAWQERAAAIEDIQIWDVDDPMLNPEHINDRPIQYEVSPPVGGPHNGLWQECTGVVYDSQVPNEHAVHSLEHGAIWITYEPSRLPDDQVDHLAGLVEGNDYTMVSQFPGMDAPISLQAWGYQLKLQDAGDDRIREFITTLRNRTGPEAGRATCGGPDSVRATGSTPITSGENPMGG